MKSVLAINGSTRQNSSNLSLIKAVTELAKDQFTLTLFAGIDTLPHYNADLDRDAPPQEIAQFREKIRRHDGVLICTPEYAMGVPGTLKNALDWTVSSMEFSGKPVALITASSSGHKAHPSLLDTLSVIEARITDETQLLISFIKTKIHDGQISDTKTLSSVINLINAFATLLKSSQV